MISKRNIIIRTTIRHVNIIYYIIICKRKTIPNVRTFFLKLIGFTKKLKLLKTRVLSWQASYKNISTNGTVYKSHTVDQLLLYRHILLQPTPIEVDYT